MTTATNTLIQLLQQAYSGELAAALAYAGHWRAVRDKTERAEIRAIELEELEHREWVGEMLTALGAEPSVAKECVMGCLGAVAGALCHVTGWVGPMYGAGLIEARNVGEYDRAADLADQAGRQDLIERLNEMSAAEARHEAYFRAKVRARALGSLLPWPVSTSAQQV